jgi:hypothetical protein
VNFNRLARFLAFFEAILPAHPGYRCGSLNPEEDAPMKSLLALLILAAALFVGACNSTTGGTTAPTVNPVTSPETSPELSPVMSPEASPSA